MRYHKKPTTFISEVQLKVSDLKKATKFYTTIVGLKIKQHSKSMVSFTSNNQETLLTIYQPDNVQQHQKPTTGLYHIALLLPSRSDLAQITQHFIDHNVRFGAGDHLVSEAIYLADPDGNGIEIYADRDSESWIWEEGKIAMTTDPLDFDSLLKEQPNSHFEGLPNDTVIGHVHLQVNDLKQNERFYVDGLGFSIVNRYGKHAVFISDNGYHHHIAFNNWAGDSIKHAENNETGLASMSILFASDQLRNERLTALQELDIPVHQENGYYYAYDPSRVQVKLIVSE